MIQSSAVRHYLYFITLFSFPIPLYIFIEQILGRGYKSIIRRIWQAHIPTLMVALLLDIANVFPMSVSAFALSFLLMLGIFVAFPIATIAAYKGNFEARMLQAGLVALMLAGMHDTLVGLRVIPAWRWIFAWGVFAFIIILAYILERRFAQARRQLQEYSHTLEQKVEDRTQELIMQSKMASLGNLVAGIAHEMNNPVGVIHSAADITGRSVRRIKTLLQGDHDEEQLNQSFDLLEQNSGVITNATDRVAKIVQSLRSFARLDEALFQDADIHQNIDTTLTLLSHELRDKADIIKEYGDIPRIQCYPNELNQAFMNVLRNATQAIERQGTITIETYADKAQVYVKISDTGKGIPSEDLSQIFNPGFTTQSDGVGKGLGLSIVYNVVQKHQGDVKVDSDVGKGTEITIALPIEQPRRA
jgi:signal transduction histidine kinase